MNNYYCMIIADIVYGIIQCSVKHLQCFLTMLIALHLSIIYIIKYIYLLYKGNSFMIDASS